MINTHTMNTTWAALLSGGFESKAAEMHCLKLAMTAQVEA